MATFTSEISNNESFKKSMQPAEKVHYKGELRIVGQVVNQLTDKEPIGYVIMVEKTQKFKMYTVEQTKALLNKFKFVNAALENGKIINTECSMTRMPKFNTQMNVIGNPGVIILGEIVDGNKKIGYRAMDMHARIVDVEETELVRLSSNGVDIINAKIVRRDNKDTISAIKSEFTKIEKAKLNEFLASKRVTKQQKDRYEKHIQKILNTAAPIVLSQMFTNRDISRINFSDLWAWRESEDMYGRFYEPLKEYKIFCTEIATEKYGIRLSDLDKELLKKVGLLSRRDRLNYCKERMDNETKFFMLGFLQFALNNKDVYDRVLYRIRRSRYQIWFDTAKVYVDMGIASESLRRLMVDAKKINKEALESRDNFTPGRRKVRITSNEHIFKTVTFTSGKDMAQLGFTISEENKGVKYRTEYGYTKTLLYLGDIIGSEYTKYKAESRCLGDLLSIAYVNKLTKKLVDIEQEVTHYGVSKEDIIDSISIIVTIAYMFNSTAMKMFIDDCGDIFEYFGVELPEYDEIAGVDYKLHSWITMYYASGFNVFLSDNEYYDYKSSHLVDSEIINYRQIGVKHDIKHPMLQDEFASVVSLLTPDSISGNTVSKLIGRLRYL